MDAFLANLGGGIGNFFEATYLWLPIIFIAFGWYSWRRFLLRSHVLNGDWVFLEIHLARESMKSPQAMEVVLSILNQPYESTWWVRLTKGFRRTAMSLELVSTEGKIRFVMRVERNFKTLLESTLYAQHDGIEIFEIEDYTLDIDYPNDPWVIKTWEFSLDKEDAYPIKTYVDFGLDRGSEKEEAKTDPLAATLEVLSRAEKGEHMWIQIIIQATKRKMVRDGWWFTFSSWKDEGKKLAKKLQDEGKKEVKTKDGTFQTFPDRSKHLAEVIEAIERNISKPGFDCGIRAMYVAHPNVANTQKPRALSNIFKQYDTLHLNKFAFEKGNSYDLPWEDPTGHRTKWRTDEMFEAFRARAFFRWPYTGEVFVLNTEEVATIYHFPGGVVTTPSLLRVASQKAEAPANLPQ